MGGGGGGGGGAAKKQPCLTPALTFEVNKGVNQQKQTFTLPYFSLECQYGLTTCKTHLLALDLIYIHNSH